MLTIKQMYDRLDPTVCMEMAISTADKVELMTSPVDGSARLHTTSHTVKGIVHGWINLDTREQHGPSSVYVENVQGLLVQKFKAPGPFPRESYVD